MKKVFIAITSSLIILMSLNSCKKELLDIKFSLDETVLDYTIDTTSVVGDLTYIQTKYINLDSVAKANKTDISKVKKIEFKKVKFEIVLPLDAKFDGFTKGSIVVSTPGLNNAKTLISFTENDIDKTKNSFELTPASNNFMEYFNQKQMTVSCNLTSNKAITTTTKLKITLSTDLVANPAE